MKYDMFFGSRTITCKKTRSLNGDVERKTIFAGKSFSTWRIELGKWRPSYWVGALVCRRSLHRGKCFYLCLELGLVFNFVPFFFFFPSHSAAEDHGCRKSSCSNLESKHRKISTSTTRGTELTTAAARNRRGSPCQGLRSSCWADPWCQMGTYCYCKKIHHNHEF